MLNSATPIMRYLATLLIATFQISATAAENYVPPPAGTKSLVRDISARRNADGTVTVFGVVLLPERTKILVDRVLTNSKLPEQTETMVGSGGAFSVGPLTDQGRAPKAGAQHVQVLAHFNGAWQPREVLKVVGKRGKNLPESAPRPYDPEFPDAGGRLEDTRAIQFPLCSKKSQC